VFLFASELSSVVWGLVIVALVAVFAYFLCAVAGREAWGRTAAAVIGILGALLVLADHL
jgi:hypothetical protein